MTDWHDFKANLEKDQQTPALPPPQWPATVAYTEFAKQAVAKPRSLIKNLLDCGSRILFGGGSKTFKTWLQCDLAVCLACGAPWLGFECESTRVLYVNLELREYYIQKRFASIIDAKGIDCSLSNLTVLNLRGFGFKRADFCEHLLKVCLDQEISTVFIDPFYKLLSVQDDENNQTQMGEVLRSFDPINKKEITTSFGIHFSKGNQAGKDPEDRISGAGTIVRDADDVITLTKHETNHAFTLDFLVRDHPPVDPFVIQWDAPVMVRTDLDPAKIKKPLGRRQSCDPDDLLLLIESHDDELKTKDLLTLVHDQLGWSPRTTMTKLNFLCANHQIFKSKLTEYWNVKAR